MTSSQPVITPTAVIFTPDNKYAFAYSGLITSSSDTVLLDFTTLDNYMVAKFTPVYATDAGDNAEFEIEINGQIVYVVFITAATQYPPWETNIIFPPNSTIKVLGSVGNDRVLGAMITAKVFGMPETGFQ